MRVRPRGPSLLLRWIGAFGAFVLAVVAATALLGTTNAIEFECYSYDRIRTVD